MGDLKIVIAVHYNFPLLVFNRPTGFDSDPVIY